MSNRSKINNNKNDKNTRNNILSNKPQTEGNTNFLNTKKQFQMFPTFTIKQLKDNMKNLGISVREFIYE